jgi:hypothetical protein
VSTPPDLCPAPEERIEAIAAVPHHLAGLAEVAELLDQFQQPDLGPDDLLVNGRVWGCAEWAKLETDVSEIKVTFRILPEYPTPNFPPSWNVAPTDNLPIVRYEPRAGSRTLDLMRWGLVPYWGKDIKIGFSTMNAMAETIELVGQGHDDGIAVSPREQAPQPLSEQRVGLRKDRHC